LQRADLAEIAGSKLHNWSRRFTPLPSPQEDQRLNPIEPEAQPAAPVLTSSTLDWLAPATLAPAWHTLLLIAGIVAISFGGAKTLPGAHGSHSYRLATYAFTACMELVLLAWVWFGLRLRKIPFRSIFGEISGGFRTLAIDTGSACVFWCGSLFALASLRIAWMAAEEAITHQPFSRNGQPDPTDQRTLHTLTSIAPSHWSEIAAWILLCILAAFVEEVVFRGYLQRQFTAWSRGALPVGVVFSALLFGFAHGYQGIRNMVLLSVFGILFSLLAIFRRNIRAGIIAHAWQDIIAGLLLSLMHANHVL
jgi:membrane protease YdiL (CAAX protease family)